MKRADLIASLVLMIFSIYFMWKSAELPIGWIPDKGPGGGFYPFWLATGMLICVALIFIRTLVGLTPESQSSEPFFKDIEVAKMIGTVTVALTALIGAIHVIGVYFAVPIFVIFYMRYLGDHSWRNTIIISLAIPVATFLFFEKLLIILLPKGLTDEWFYIFY